MKIVKIGTGILFVLFFTVGTILWLSFHAVRRSLPKTSGTLKLQNLRSNIKIYRDYDGIPHIITRNEEDLFFAMGFVHAQDRLWQMDVLRRIARGTLSEILGRNTIEVDRLFRKLGLFHFIEENSSKLSPESRIMLSQYAAGVNAYIETFQNDLPIEFIILNYKPERWEIEDSFACQRLMALVLSLNRQYDLVHGALIEKFGNRKIHEILPDDISASSEVQFFQQVDLIGLEIRIQTVLDIIRKWVPITSESSCWVVAGEKSNSGKPIIANNPITSITLPSIWYEIHVIAPFINSCGVSKPGLPGIFSGFNQSMGWALNDGRVDDLDFYLEKINFDRYLYKYQWTQIDTMTEFIPIKNEQPESLVVYETRTGPIISDMSDISEYKISVKWAGYDFSDDFLGYYRILKSSTVQDFEDAIKYLQVPAKDVIYADTNDNISQWTVGAIPIRKPGKGTVPGIAWSGRDEWQGYYQYQQLPHVLNPQEDYIISSPTLGEIQPVHHHENTYREQRLFELLTEKNQCSVEDFKRIQLDNYSKLAEQLVARIKNIINDIHVEDELLNYFYDSIKYWDYETNTDETGSAIFNVFVSRLLDNIFHDELGDTLYSQFLKCPGFAINVLNHLLSKPVSSWIDDIQTAHVENMNDILPRSLNDAFNYLISQHGKIIDDWRWGNLHQVKLEHPLVYQGNFENVFQRFSLPCPGANCTVNLAPYSFMTPYQPVAIASLRQIIQLDDKNVSFSVLLTGQSGQPLDVHYRDQTDLWLNADYHTSYLDVDTIVNSDYDILTLIPK